VGHVRNLRQTAKPYMWLFLSAHKAEMPGAEYRELLEVSDGR
jgi:hypothetical protein